MSKTSTNFLYLSSKMKSSGTNNNFEILFNNSNPLFTLKDGEKLRIKPVQVVVPNDWNAINRTNNSFKFTLSSNDYTIFIDEGNPDVEQLAENIETKMNEEVGNNFFSVSFDEYTKIYEFSSSGGEFTLDFNVSNSANFLLGFPENSVVSSSSGFLEAPNKPDLTPYSQLVFHSNIAKKALSVVNGVLSNTDVLFSININEGVGSNVKFENQGDEFEQDLNSNISSFSFRITDIKNNLIPLTGDINMVFALSKITKDKRSPNDILPKN